MPEIRSLRATEEIDKMLENLQKMQFADLDRDLDQLAMGLVTKPEWTYDFENSVNSTVVSFFERHL